MAAATAGSADRSRFELPVAAVASASGALERWADARGILDSFDDEFLAFRPRVDAVAPVQSFRQQLAQITFAREMLRRMKDRVMQFAELDFQIAFLRDFQRVLHRFGHSLKRAFISSADRR